MTSESPDLQSNRHADYLSLFQTFVQRNAQAIQAELDRIDSQLSALENMNYPNPHMTIHRDARCNAIRQSHKAEPRISQITRNTLSSELAKFAEKEYTFAANPAQNEIR